MHSMYTEIDQLGMQYDIWYKLNIITAVVIDR